MNHQPTTSIRATATKAAIIEALFDLAESPDFYFRFWSHYDAERLERLARKIREGYAEEDRHKATQTGSINHEKR